MAHKPLTDQRRQRGAALVIVLILVATLSFVVLSLTQVTTLAAHRSLNVGARQELIWRALGVEVLAVAALKKLHSIDNVSITPENELFSTAHILPMEDGAGRVFFLDRTACFNVNSLVTYEEGVYALNETARDEFLALAQSVNVTAGEASIAAAALVDWIDADENVEPGGAEDGTYSALPTPYRTGGALLADISEMRAMSGVPKEVFNTLRPYLCVLPQAAPAKVNVNFLTVDRAPVLVGLLQGEIGLVDAVTIIDARPPGGFSSVEQFMSIVRTHVEETEETLSERLAVKSAYIAARSELSLGAAALDISLAFVLDENGEAKLISRQFGDEQ